MIKALSTLVIYSFTAAFLQIAAIAQSGTGSYGLLWLKIDPAGSQVSLDGQFLDMSVWLLSLPPGFHTIQVRKALYRTDSSGFDISGGQSLHLDISLKSILGVGDEDGYNLSVP